jgi:hypothetical protein
MHKDRHLQHMDTYDIAQHITDVFNVVIQRILSKLEERTLYRSTLVAWTI